MKKLFVVMFVTLFFVGCTDPDGTISHSEYERIADICDKNDGIKLFRYYDTDGNNGNMDLIIQVQCNDGAWFKDTHDEIKDRTYN